MPRNAPTIADGRINDRVEQQAASRSVEQRAGVVEREGRAEDRDARRTQT